MYNNNYTIKLSEVLVLMNKEDIEIPENEWTKSQRDFIGSTFKTPKGGVLTVVGVSRDKVGTQPKFICECSVCSLDKELWEYGSITTTKPRLLNYNIPCGCSKSPVWKESQYYVRVKRRCKELGYTFHGFVGDFKGNKTKIDMENPNTNNRWDSCSVNSFMKGTLDPKEGIENKSCSSREPDTYHVSQFMASGKFTNENIFLRNQSRKSKDGRYAYWDLYCPLCSNDEYVINGLCTGVFTSIGSDLKRGIIPCRCSKSYRWNQDQIEYKIKDICKEEGNTFRGWYTENGYINKTSRFKWECSRGHACVTMVDNFLNGGVRCSECYMEDQKGRGRMYGYYPCKVHVKDYLYVLNFGNFCIKVGRSFNINNRINSLSNLSGIGKDSINILKVYTDSHQKVYRTEQRLHKELTKGGYHLPQEWTTETFSIDSEDLIYKLLEESELVEGFYK